MQIKTYSKFEEVEHDFIKKAPQIVYKYRSWKDPNHKNLLLKNMLWFSHPFDLNNDLDVRPDYVYNKQKIFSEEFFYHIYKNMPATFAYLNGEQKEKVAKKQWEKIK